MVEVSYSYFCEEYPIEGMIIYLSLAFLNWEKKRVIELVQSESTMTGEFKVTTSREIIEAQVQFKGMVCGAAAHRLGYGWRAQIFLRHLRPFRRWGLMASVCLFWIWDWLRACGSFIRQGKKFWLFIRPVLFLTRHPDPIQEQRGTGISWQGPSFSWQVGYAGAEAHGNKKCRPKLPFSSCGWEHQGANCNVFIHVFTYLFIFGYVEAFVESCDRCFSFPPHVCV